MLTLKPAKHQFDQTASLAGLSWFSCSSTVYEHLKVVKTQIHQRHDFQLIFSQDECEEQCSCSLTPDHYLYAGKLSCKTLNIIYHDSIFFLVDITAS